MQRGSFLSDILAAGIAPAVLSRSSIMGLWMPRQPTVLTLEAVWVHKEPYGIRGFINGVPWARQKIIHNEQWMEHS